VSLPSHLTHYSNFELAFTRIVRGGNKEYKQFYRHLFSSFGLALRENLGDLISTVKAGTYEPSKATVVYQPKRSGVLRPLTILSLQDLIVYQAIVNRIAAAFEADQQKHALTKSFGAIFAGTSSPFFYRSWKRSYRAYNRGISAAFKIGNDYIADFDLVSFYELIDHNLLKTCLEQRVKNAELIDLLLKCLRRWTSDKAGDHMWHGVPQGPEPSAFLAECFLFRFDRMAFKDIRYFRYVDDIRMMARDEVPIRRALLRLDLASKELGLVPQAQKIECRRVSDLSEVLKTIPSGLASAGSGEGEEEDANAKEKELSQAELLKMFRTSLKRDGRLSVIDDVTRFKFSLFRLSARRDVLRRIAPFLVKRPDLSWVLAAYLKRFPEDAEAANILLEALKRDPTYDASAANYIDAMDICEPQKNNFPHRRVIQTANLRSEEKSILLRIASLSFRGRRRSVAEATKLIESEADPRVRAMVIHRLFGNAPRAPFATSACEALLRAETSCGDADLARFAASLLLRDWPWSKWTPPKTVNRSVDLFMLGLGLRRRAPKRRGVLEVFFQERFKIGMSISWRKALNKDWREGERRCLRLQTLLLGDPTARITYLDTFNELLIQNFSTKHPGLVGAYKKATKPKTAQPDYGGWLYEGAFKAALPVASKWLQSVHDTRVKGELAHAKARKTGAPTKPISFKHAEKLQKGATIAWAELIREWKKVL
jgi:hypothetical protein